MTKLEKLYSIIENSRDVGVKLPDEVIRQVKELEEKIIKDGVSKIRLTTTPIVHEKSFKKDKFGQKLYGFFQTLMTTPIDDF